MGNITASCGSIATKNKEMEILLTLISIITMYRETNVTADASIEGVTSIGRVFHILDSEILGNADSI